MLLLKVCRRTERLARTNVQCAARPIHCLRTSKIIYSKCLLFKRLKDELQLWRINTMHLSEAFEGNGVSFYGVHVTGKSPNYSVKRFKNKMVNHKRVEWKLNYNIWAIFWIPSWSLSGSNTAYKHEMLNKQEIYTGETTRHTGRSTVKCLPKY